MPLTKPRPGTPMPSVNPAPFISTIRTSGHADIDTTYSRVHLHLKNLHHTFQHGASSLTSRLTSERCKRRKLRSSFQRTQSNSRPTAPSTNSDEASSSFHRVQKAAKSLLHNLRNRTAPRSSETSLMTGSRSASPEPITRPPVFDTPLPLPPVCPASTLNTPTRQRINRRALRKAIHRAPDLRSLRRRAPHAGFMPRVLPTLVRGEGENWSLDGTGGKYGVAEQWGWVGENERGYVQFYVEPDLEPVLEEGDADGEGGGLRNGWGEEVWEC